MKRLALIFVVLVLAGCTSFGVTSPDVRLATACDSYARALGVANDFRHLLGEEEVAIVQATRDTIPPLCAEAADASFKGTAFDYVTALDAVSDALARLNRINRIGEV